METQKSDTHDRELCISRVLDAPIDLVWEVWTNPEHIANWWGPNDFTTTISAMDVKPGGTWNLVLHGPDGTDYENRSIFTEVVHYKRLVFDHISYPHIIFTIDFEAQGEQTLIRWHMLFDSAEEFIKVVKKHGAEEGQKQNVQKLNAYLAGLKTNKTKLTS